MRKFRYLNPDNFYGFSLTTNKIYDLIEYKSSVVDKIFDRIQIKNDIGEYGLFLLYFSPGKKVFEEVTIEVRNDKIDKILS